MKKILMLLLVPLAILCIAWGAAGHRTIGIIASRHLSPQATQAVAELLDHQPLAEVANWADEVRNDPEYRSTAPWHYINVPPGLSYEEFRAQISAPNTANVYTAIVAEEKILRDPHTARSEKITALKFIVHFVGDIHQPMHVSRAEDKGGNTIQLNFNGQGTNLHALWDTKLLEYRGLNDQQLAQQYDKAAPAEIRAWQQDPPERWAWESYQISTKLYSEVDHMSSRAIGEDYYRSHIQTVQRRIEQAGYRLAGVLNELFKNARPGEYSGPPATEGTPPAGQPATLATIKLQEVGGHIGENVKVCGKVYGYKDEGSFVLVNLGADYPNQLLTVVLRGNTKSLAGDMSGKMICVSGKAVLYRDRPEIVVTDKAQLSNQ